MRDHRSCSHRDPRPALRGRRGVAAAELAICLPVVFLLLSGLWEVGRITQVQQIMWNSAREAARDASLGQNSLQGIAGNLATYLQSADPIAFAKGHPTTLKAPVVTLPANTSGYTCWDTTSNRELFTMTFQDLNDGTITDPTNCKQLDRYQIGVQVPYAGVGWIPVASLTGKTRLLATVTWVSMRDSPFQITQALPAQ